jgi:hypothetical protein
VALLKLYCPECNAKLKSSTGFTVGETVSCPKCETEFTVRKPADEDEETEEPKKGTAAKGKDVPTGTKPGRAIASSDGDEEDEKPKKKKKKPAYDEDDEPVRSYKNSPLRYAILGILVLTMLVLGFFLVRKIRNEREVAGGGDTAGGGGSNEGPTPNGPRRDKQNPGRPPFNPGGPGGPIGKFPNPGVPPGFNPGVPPGINNPGVPPGFDPGVPPGGNPKVNPGVGAGGGGNPLDAVLGGPLPIAEVQILTQKFRGALVGTWTADLGGGATEELTYTATGTYTAKLTGPKPATTSGKYTVLQLVGSRGLRLRLDDGSGPRTIVVNFDGDELEHPTLQKGVTGTFHKK